MSDIDNLLASKFKCPRCNHIGAKVQRLSMSGTGISRLLEIQPYRYAFVSCNNCGYTEVFSLDVLEDKDDLGNFLDVLFMD